MSDSGLVRRVSRVARDPAAIRFLVAGGTVTVIGYGMFRLALRAYAGRAGAAGLAQGTAYLVGAIISYALNSRWTFRSEAGHGRTMPRFFAAHSGVLMLSSSLMQLGVGRLHEPPLLCFVVITGFTTVINFLLQRTWVFPSPDRGAGARSWREVPSLD